MHLYLGVNTDVHDVEVCVFCVFSVK